MIAQRPIQTNPPASSATLLPILLDLGVLQTNQLSSLPTTTDNATLELYLRMNNLASEEQLLQAYAKLYQIPFVRLGDRKIKREILLTIPELTARRYDIVAYDKEKDVLSVALASPRRFRSNDRSGLLHRLQTELGMQIAPALSPLADIRAAQQGYERAAGPAIRPQALPGTAVTGDDEAVPVYPTVSLVGRTIEPSVLNLFPVEAAERYSMIAFAKNGESFLSVAALEPAGKATQQVLAYLQKQNRLTINLYQTDRPSLDYALKLYGVQATINTDRSNSASKGSTAASTSAQPIASANIPVAKPISSQPTGRNTSTPVVKADELTLNPNEGDVAIKAGVSLAAIKTNNQNGASAGQSKSPSVTSAESDNFDALNIQSIQDLIAVVRSGNVPRMVTAIVALAISQRASDVHIEAEKEDIRLRYRIDGELTDILTMPRVLQAPLVSRVKILSQMKIDENRVPQDGRYGISFRNRDIDLRISTLPIVHGEKVVIRILDKTTGIMSLESMGLDSENLKRVVVNVEKPYGVVLSTGPTGSGKSTTLYAVLQRISRPNVNVVTLEDPVEYEMPGINQTQIKPKIGFTFAEGLRSILRQDPNIIMVGEIRDKETAEMATHAALTGHLVLSTLHTNSAAGALPRLINMGIEPFLITSSINAVIGQRLVRRVCPDCKQPETLPPAVIEEISQDLAKANIDPKLKEPSSWQFMRGKGCPNCNDGYRGRIGIFEVLTMSEQIELLAVKKEPASVLEEQALKEGMITMKQDGLLKAIGGQTTVEEVMKATTE